MFIILQYSFYFQKHDTLLARQEEMILELKHLKANLKRCEDEKLILAKGCDNLEANNIELQKSLSSAYIDLGSLKIGIDHYMKKANSLQQTLVTNIQITKHLFTLT